MPISPEKTPNSFSRSSSESSDGDDADAEAHAARPDSFEMQESLRQRERGDLLSHSFVKRFQENFEKTVDYYKKNGRRFFTLAAGIAIAKIALDYGFLSDRGKMDKAKQGKADTEEVLKDAFIPEEAWPITSFDDKTGELTLDYRGRAVHIKRFNEGLREDTDDEPGTLMKLVQKGLRSEKLSGVNYDLEDEKAFSDFVRQEAEKLVAEMNAKGGQEPVLLSQLTENEWLQLSFMIVQRHLEYDKVVLETDNPDSKKEDEKISQMPLDTMLLDYRKGVCRHYAVAVTKVGDTLKKIFPSPNLDNVSIETLQSDTLNHAYSAVLEQEDDDLNIRFVDITGQKDKFRAADDLDALRGKRLSYQSAGDFLLSKAGEKMYDREVVIETFRNLLLLHAQDPTARQFYMRELGDLFLESTSEDERAKGYKLYEKSIALYRQNSDVYRQRQQAGSSELIRLYPVVEPLTKLLEKYIAHEQWNAAADLLFDDRLFSSEYTVVAPENVSSFDRYKTIDAFMELLKQKGEYEKILDIHAVRQLPTYLESYVFEAFLETGKIFEAMDFLLEKSKHDSYEAPEWDFEVMQKFLSIFQDKITLRPELVLRLDEARVRDFFSRLALSRAGKGEMIRKKLDGRASLFADETREEMQARWKDLLHAREELLMPLMRLGLILDPGNGSTLSLTLDAFDSEIQELAAAGAYTSSDVQNLHTAIAVKFPDFDSARESGDPFLDAHLTYARKKLQEFSALAKKK